MGISSIASTDGSPPTAFELKQFDKNVEEDKRVHGTFTAPQTKYSLGGKFER